MKTRLLLLVVALLSPLPALAQSTGQLKEQRIQASYLLAFGRKASADEVRYWSGQPVNDVAGLLKRHKDYLRADRGTREESIRNSYIDSFGRYPEAGEIKHWAAGVDTYAELMAKHFDWMRGNAAERDATIVRSYQSTLGRKPSDAELNYWRQQGTLNFITLAACHEQWKQANSQKTSGQAAFSPNSALLSSVSLATPVAQEVPVASPSTKILEGRLIAAGGQNLIAAGGQNLIAAGGQNLIAAGGQNLIAAGGQNLRAAAAGR